MGNWPQASFAAVTPADALASPLPQKLVLSQSAPNPARGTALVRYALPKAASVTLSIFDLQGRKIVTVLSHQRQAPGPHQISIQTASWRPGCYLYRLDAGGMSATRKMVILN